MPSFITDPGLRSFVGREGATFTQRSRESGRGPERPGYYCGR